MDADTLPDSTQFCCPGSLVLLSPKSRLPSRMATPPPLPSPLAKAISRFPHNHHVIFIYDTKAVLSLPIFQPVTGISLIDSPTLTAMPINCKGHAETLNPPNAGCHSLFGPYSSPSSESSPSSSCKDFSQNDTVGEDDEDKEGDDHLGPLEDYPHVPFGGHAQTQSSPSACYAPPPPLLSSHRVMHHAPPTQVPVHAPHMPLNMHSQMTPSINLGRRRLCLLRTYCMTSRGGSGTCTHAWLLV